MGRLDIAMRQLMNDRNVFADVFNFGRADGHKFDPSGLREMDPSASVTDALSGLSLSQSSDIARKLVVRGDESRTCALLLLENQSYSDRLMPFRYLYAAAMHWRRCVSDIIKLHRQVKDLKGSDDFLTGFGKSDRLPHVYMMALYAGKKPWNGPLCLAELLDKEDVGSGLYEPDCRINLLSLVELSDMEVARFSTNEMKVMATAVRLQDNLKKLDEIVQTNPAFRSVNGDLYDVVKFSTGYELPQPKYTRGNDMRKAFAEYKKSVRDEGHQEGLLEGIQEGLQKGLQKGAEKRNNEIVANMLKDHCPMAAIEKYTRLPLEQILQIAKANNIPFP